MNIPPVSSVAPPAPADAAPLADLNEVFAQGVTQFMGIILQSGQSDVQDACNDTVSTPDAPF